MLPPVLLIRATTENNESIRPLMAREFCAREQFMSNIEHVLKELTSPYTFNNLQMLIRAAGLEYTLQGNRPLTLFAPHDGAFDTLTQRTGYDLLTDIEKLNQLLRYHIVPLKLSSVELKIEATEQINIPGLEPPTAGESIQLPTEVEGEILHVILKDSMQVEGVRVLLPDIEADNGMIHVIEDILWPPGLSETSFGERSRGNAPEREEK